MMVGPPESVVQVGTAAYLQVRGWPPVWGWVTAWEKEQVSESVWVLTYGVASPYPAGRS